MMNNNDILKKLRVALQLRDEQIVEILQLVDFRISKSELGAFFRNENHPNFVECGDQVLRNFLNGLVIHLRGTKEHPKNPIEVLSENRIRIGKDKSTGSANPSLKALPKAPRNAAKGGKPFKKNTSKTAPKIQVVENVKFNNGKSKK